MPKASRQVLCSALAVSVGAFALGSRGSIREYNGILRALASEGAPTVSARALVMAPRVMPLGLPDAKAAKAVLSASLLHHHRQAAGRGRDGPEPGDERLGARGGDAGSRARFHHRGPRSRNQ